MAKKKNKTFVASKKGVEELLAFKKQNFEVLSFLSRNAINIKCCNCSYCTVTTFDEILNDKIQHECEKNDNKINEKKEVKTNTTTKPKFNNTNIGYREQQIADGIKKFYKKEIQRDVKDVVPGYEIDIYLPEDKIAIEVNSLVWHSQMKGGKDKYYHLKKSLAAQYLGIEMYHLFISESDIRTNFTYILDKVRRYIEDKSAFIKENGNTIRINRNFNVVPYYLKKGYSIIEVIPPREHFIDKKYTKTKESSSENYIDSYYDCGEVIMAKTM